MDKPRIIFRVDGNNSIGLGHITRCCALADMLRSSFEIYFYTRANSKFVLKDIKKYCNEIFVLDNTSSYNEEASVWASVLSGNEIVVLDGYNFNTYYQQQVKSKGCKLVCVDDIHAYHFVADVIINHAPGAEKNKYSAEPYTQLYLGSDYALLRKIFLEAAKTNKQNQPNNSSVLICFGGADPNNVTLQVLEKLTGSFPGKKVKVVVGSAYVHFQRLSDAVKVNNNVTLRKSISPEEMLQLMQESPIAITAASSVALEYLCVKGNLFLMLTADNQKDLYKSLIEKKCANEFDALLKNNTENLNGNHCYLIDGKSNQRLLSIFNILAKN